MPQRSGQQQQQKNGGCRSREVISVIYHCSSDRKKESRKSKSAFKNLLMPPSTVLALTTPSFAQWQTLFFAVAAHLILGHPWALNRVGRNDAMKVVIVVMSYPTDCPWLELVLSKSCDQNPNSPKLSLNQKYFG